MAATRKRSLMGARALGALLVLIFVLAGSVLSTGAQRPNGAGLVIRHGDGTLIYAYVQFDEESISGIDLLTRSGIDATIAPFGGLGGAVCSLNGEGCPADDCFCHSYQSPSYFWQYFALSDAGWRILPTGPASRTLYDGDVDGWSWTSGDSGLPATTIDEIALMNGIDRNPPEPTATPEPPPTGTSIPPTSTPEPTVTPEPDPTATITPEPTATSTQTSEDAPTASPAPPATDTPTSTETATPAPTSTSTPAPVPTSTQTPEPAATPTQTPEPAATPTQTPEPAPSSRAVVVAPGATPEVLAESGDNQESGTQSYLIFAAMAAIVLAAGGFILLRNRTTRP